jgi:hypothetical protein
MFRACGFRAASELAEQVLTHVSDELPDLQSLIFDQFGTLQSLWAEVLELHQLRIGQNYPDTIIQIVQPFSYMLFIHTHVI